MKNFLLNPVGTIDFYLSRFQNLAYLNIAIVLIFYVLAFFYLERKITFNKLNNKTSEAVKLYLLIFISMLSFRFMPAEFANSATILFLLLPYYLVSTFYDSTIFFIIIILLNKIPKHNKLALALFSLFMAIYLLMAFTTFYHIKRLPSKTEFMVGPKILALNPLEYFFIALKNRPIQFIASIIIPLFFIAKYFNKIDLNLITINTKFKKSCFKSKKVIAMLFVFIAAFFYLETNLRSFNSHGLLDKEWKLNQAINYMGLFKYQRYLLGSDFNYKDINTYNPKELKPLVSKALADYPADSINKAKSMPQIVINYANESFIYPERIDPSITNQSEINQTFKRLIKNGSANGVQSTFPFIYNGTVLGESILLSSLLLLTPKQNHPSLVSYYKELGYTTIYVHIVLDNFYNYLERSKYYGFDEVYLGSHFKKTWGDDNILFPFLQNRIDKAIAGKEKVFISFIDISRHNPYEIKDKAEYENLAKKYGITDNALLGFTKKSIVGDKYLASFIEFINQKDVEIAMSICADHVSGRFAAQEKLTNDEDLYLSEFLFYNNKRKLSLSNDYNYIHQSLVPSLFLQSLGMPLRPLDKYILDKSKTEKTYNLDLMKDLAYDMGRGNQIGKPLFDLKPKE